jgi:hypothetical protein
MKPIPEWSEKLELGGRFEFGPSVGEIDVFCETADCRPPPKKLVLDVKFDPFCIPLYPGVDEAAKLDADWNDACCGTGVPVPLFGETS